MASHHQKLVGLDFKTNGEGQNFGKMNDFVVNKHIFLSDGSKNAWWSNIFFKAPGRSNNLKYRQNLKDYDFMKKFNSGTLF
jgi:hypothetical protein